MVFIQCAKLRVKCNDRVTRPRDICPRKSLMIYHDSGESEGLIDKLCSFVPFTTMSTIFIISF